MSECFVSGVSAKIALYKYSSFPFISFAVAKICGQTYIDWNRITEQHQPMNNMQIELTQPPAKISPQWGTTPSAEDTLSRMKSFT